MPSPLYDALKVLTETPSIRHFLTLNDPKALEQARDALARYDECAEQACSYYQHYLAYGPPDLTHEGFHAAEKVCESWQKRASDWLDRHPTGMLPKGLEEACARAEMRVRA
jgi:hypothetical protein